MHHPAIPFEDAPALYARLASMDEPAARALQFLLLCCAPRAAEVLGAEWSMIDGDVYHVPARLLKSGKKSPFKGRDIPLTEEALAVIEFVAFGVKVRVLRSHR